MIPGLAITILLILLGACSTEQKEFFQRVKEESARGATWHFVGPTSTNPKSGALALPARCINPETGVEECDPFILWKMRR